MKDFVLAKTYIANHLRCCATVSSLFLRWAIDWHLHLVIAESVVVVLAMCTP